MRCQGLNLDQLCVQYKWLAHSTSYPVTSIIYPPRSIKVAFYRCSQTSISVSTFMPLKHFLSDFLSPSIFKSTLILPVWSLKLFLVLFHLQILPPLLEIFKCYSLILYQVYSKWNYKVLWARRDFKCFFWVSYWLY